MRTLVTAFFMIVITLGSLQPGYGMSFGNHHNNGGPANEGVTHGGGNGNQNGNGNNSLSYDAHPYQVPVPLPEPSSILLLGSGVIGLGLWRLRK